MAEGRAGGRAQVASAEQGRLTATPQPPVGAGPTGMQQLGLDTGRDGYLYVPPGYLPTKSLPLVLMLHGAGGNARNGRLPFAQLADDEDMILLAVDSRASTWDVIGGDFGHDTAFIDRALEQTSGRYSIDPSQVAVEGFSDGASYALSIGITTGDLFSHVIACSPGFMVPRAQIGEPRIFISHGTNDRVLPIDRCSSCIVPRLRDAGYDVTSVEFDGPYTVPPGIAADAMRWFFRKPQQFRTGLVRCLEIVYKAPGGLAGTIRAGWLTRLGVLRARER